VNTGLARNKNKNAPAGCSGGMCFEGTYCLGACAAEFRQGEPGEAEAHHPEGERFGG
jgi:hypothetical protein